MKKIWAIIISVVLLLSAPASFAEEIAQYEELVVGSTTRLSGSFFTEMFGNNTSDVDVRMLLHGYNLMRWDNELGNYGLDLSVVSGVAASDLQDGSRRYTIGLYDDLYYSDGTQITARDYAFAILLSVAPEVAQIGGTVTEADHILGIDEYKSGEATAIRGVHVLGDFQLSITVKGDYLPFFYELALLNYNPYPIHVIAPGCEVADDGLGVYIRSVNENAGDLFTAELLRETILNAETGYLSHPSVVSGPYVLTDYNAETATASFAINPYYKGNAAGFVPQIPRLVFRPVEGETMIQELADGTVGLLNKCVLADTINQGMQLVMQGDVSISNYPRSGYSFIAFSCEKDAVGEQAVRQAIAYCFDKDTFVTDYVRNYGVRVDGYYGIGQWMYRLVQGTLEPTIEEPAANASAAELAAYEEQLKAWEELSLDNVKLYNLDLAQAQRMLEEAGWTLNAEGGRYDPARDEYRCKQVGNELVKLDLKMIYPEGNIVGDYLPAFVDNLKTVGVKLSVEARPFTQLLETYYRQTERDADLIYLASNFAYVFEPSATFEVADAYQGEMNRTGIRDEHLYQLAVDMRKTEPGDVLTYLQKWVLFQEYFAEALPCIPVYSNVYFDFYTATLQNYTVSADATWAQAIVNAYLGDPMENVENLEEPGVMEDEFTDDGEESFEDEFMDEEEIEFVD